MDTLSFDHRYICSLLGCCSHSSLLCLDDLGQLLVSLHAVLLRPVGHGLSDPVPPLGGRGWECFERLLQQLLLVRGPGRVVHPRQLRRGVEPLAGLGFLLAPVQGIFFLT